MHADGATYENFVRLREKVEAAGLKVWNIGNLNVHNMEEVTLNLPGRDQKIEEYKTYLRNIGKAGIYYTTYAHMGNGIWSTARENTRGGASARGFDLAKADAGYWDKKVFKGPLTHGRVYSQKEIWDNYTYFIKAVDAGGGGGRCKNRHSSRRPAGARIGRCSTLYLRQF